MPNHSHEWGLVLAPRKIEGGIGIKILKQLLSHQLKAFTEGFQGVGFALCGRGPDFRQTFGIFFKAALNALYARFGLFHELVAAELGLAFKFLAVLLLPRQSLFGQFVKFGPARLGRIFPQAPEEFQYLIGLLRWSSHLWDFKAGPRKSCPLVMGEKWMWVKKFFRLPG